MEEHIILWSELGSIYLLHVNHDSCSNAHIIRNIMKSVKRKSITLTELAAVAVKERTSTLESKMA